MRGRIVLNDGLAVADEGRIAFRPGTGFVGGDKAFSGIS